MATNLVGELTALRGQTSRDAVGKKIASMEWVDDSVRTAEGTLCGYWVVRFEDGTEMCFLLMNEIMRGVLFVT